MRKIKIVHYNPKWRYGKSTSIEDYKYQEGSPIEITHSQFDPDFGEYCHWLKSYGLSSWSVETTLAADETLELLNE